MGADGPYRQGAGLGNRATASDEQLPDTRPPAGGHGCVFWTNACVRAALCAFPHSLPTPDAAGSTKALRKRRLRPACQRLPHAHPGLYLASRHRAQEIFTHLVRRGLHPACALRQRCRCGSSAPAHRSPHTPSVPRVVQMMAASWVLGDGGALSLQLQAPPPLRCAPPAPASTSTASSVLARKQTFVHSSSYPGDSAEVMTPVLHHRSLRRSHGQRRQRRMGGPRLEALLAVVRRSLKAERPPWQNRGMTTRATQLRLAAEQQARAAGSAPGVAAPATLQSAARCARRRHGGCLLHGSACDLPSLDPIRNGLPAALTRCPGWLCFTPFCRTI